LGERIGEIGSRSIVSVYLCMHNELFVGQIAEGSSMPMIAANVLANLC